MKYKHFTAMAALATALALTSNSATAAAVAVANAGFEEGPELAENGWTRGDFPGWGGSIASGRQRPGDALFDGGLPPSGDGSANEYTGWVNDGALFQSLNEVLIAGKTYTLTVDIGDRLDMAFGGYTLNLYAGAQVFAALSGFDVPEGGWLTKTLTFTATDATVGLGNRLRIGLLGGTQVNFDNVRFDISGDVGPVETPEPAMPALFGLGMISLAVARRRRA